jgi:hypothetical protein
MVVDDNDDFVGFNQVSTHHGQWRDVKIYNDVITRAVYFAARKRVTVLWSLILRSGL